MSFASGRSCVSGLANLRTVAKAHSTPAPLFNGRRCSRPSAAASNSMANRFSARSTIDRSFNALVIPMETWSSFPPEVVMLSTLAGCASTRASLTRAAAATCTVMKPDCTPGCRARNAGSPSFLSGLTSRSIRRSLMLIRSTIAIAA